MRRKRSYVQNFGFLFGHHMRLGRIPCKLNKTFSLDYIIFSLEAKRSKISESVTVTYGVKYEIEFLGDLIVAMLGIIDDQISPEAFEEV